MLMPVQVFLDTFLPIQPNASPLIIDKLISLKPASIKMETGTAKVIVSSCDVFIFDLFNNVYIGQYIFQQFNIDLEIIVTGKNKDTQSEYLHLDVMAYCLH